MKNNLLSIKFIAFVVLVNLLILFSWLLGKGTLGKTLNPEPCKPCECKPDLVNF
jgi:hypothetical protein